MTDDRDEKELRELFHALKREDEGVAPSFDKTWQGAFARRQTPFRSWRFVGAITAATVLTLLGVAARFSVRPARPPEPSIVVSEWRSPTEVLLKTLDDPLLRTVPRLGAPLGDSTLAMPEKKSGGIK